LDPELLRRLEAFAREIYEAGRRDGSAEMRAALLKLVGADPAAVARATAPPTNVRDDEAAEATRAPRGALERAVKQALTERQGQTEQELVEAVAVIDPQVSPRSIGGQLRRFRDTRYRQEGRRWFLMADEPGDQAKAGPSGLL
jgi:3,4-dihydroxy-2-butanone 4-phosphate synthase